MFFVFHGAVVLSVQESFGVQGHHLRPVGDIVESIPGQRRRGADALLGPVVDSAGSQFFVGHLPKEFPVVLPEAHDDAPVTGLLGIAQPLIVGAHEDLATQYRGVSIGLGADFGNPLDVFPGLQVPLGRYSGSLRNHVPVGSTSPHGPVPRQSGDFRSACQQQNHCCNDLQLWQ